jgi:glycerophosphoryl diester phosphodiesterase
MMFMKRIFIIAGLAVILFTTYLYFVATKVRDHPFFDKGKFLVISHQGGLGYWPSNTLLAFGQSIKMGADVLEMDARMTKDGHLVVITRDELDKTTNGTGKVRDIALSELKLLDAGYFWTTESAPEVYPPESINGGYTQADNGAPGIYPYRGMDIQVPTVTEVFQAFPNVRINIELKQPSIAASLCKLIMEFARSATTMVTSFDHDELIEFRQKCPDVATSATKKEVKKLIILTKLSLSEFYSPNEDALQLPIRSPSLELITPQLVNHAHARGIRVIVWTINDK